MIKCDICGKECKDNNGLKIHRRFHFMTEDQKGKLHKIRQEAHRKALNTMKTSVKDGKTLFEISREKARNTMLKKDENGKTGYQRAVPKIIKTRTEKDSYRTGSIKAQKTMLAKNVNGKNGYQLVIEQTLKTKASQLFEDGLNGFKHESKKAAKTVKKRYNVNNARCLGKRSNNSHSKISLKLFSDIYDALLDSLIDSTYWYCFNGEKKFQVGPNKDIYIDFVIDDIKLAIEFNGYKLITIWEADYRNNPDLVLQNCLQEINNRIWDSK